MIINFTRYCGVTRLQPESEDRDSHKYGDYYLVSESEYTMHLAVFDGKKFHEVSVLKELYNNTHRRAGDYNGTK